MSKFHSTISRRDFMKGLGIAGAGLGTVAASMPTFRDLDELVSSESGVRDINPWWAKELDFEELTTPVDWSVYQPYDDVKYPTPALFGGSTGPMSPEMIAARNQRHLDGIIQMIPGSTLRDLALDGATGGNYGSCPWDGPGVTTPESRGASGPWEGTPEDNLQMMRAAGRFYGTPKVGGIVINEHMERLFDKNAVVWEDIDEPYEDENGKKHLPQSCRYIITWMVKQNAVFSSYMLRNDESDPWYGKCFRQGKAAENIAYTHGPQIRFYMNKFVKGLGYKALKPNASSNVQFGVFSGLTEMGRTSHSTSSEYGCAQRYQDFIVTDMPIAPTKPVDGGVVAFCKTCMKCGKMCPSNSISLEKEPSYDVVDPGNNPGVKHWALNWTTCHEWGAPWDCVNCQNVCPFNHLPNGSIHDAVRATAGVTTLFNGFFSAMDDVMGYGNQKSDEERRDWWYRDLKDSRFDNLLGFGERSW